MTLTFTTMTMTLKLTIKDVKDSNVEDHNRIYARKLTETMTMTEPEPEPEPEPITLTIVITMTMSLTLTTTTTTTTIIIIMLTIAMTRKYRWVQCREGQKFWNGKRLFPFSNRAKTRQTKVVSIAVNLLCKQSSQPTNESFRQ